MEKKIEYETAIIYIRNKKKILNATLLLTTV